MAIAPPGYVLLVAVPGFNVASYDALPRRELSNGISFFQRNVAQPDQGLLGNPLSVLRLHVGVAQPSELCRCSAAIPTICCRVAAARSAACRPSALADCRC